MINPKIQHHQPFVLPPKVLGELIEFNILITIPHWKISLHLFPPLSNSHIALQHKTQHLLKMYTKTCKHYLYHYLSELSFRYLLSTPISQYYETSDFFTRKRFWQLIYLSLYIQRDKSFGNWYLYHCISKEKKYLTTDKFTRLTNIKDQLWLIYQWSESTLSTLVSKLPPGDVPSLRVV